MNRIQSRVIYKGFRTAGGWEVAVARAGQPMRLLDRPHRQEEVSLSILRDYLGDPARAADLYRDFGALTTDRFTADWELSGSEIDDVLIEVEVLRARWRRAILRG